LEEYEEQEADDNEYDDNEPVELNEDIKNDISELLKKVKKYVHNKNNWE